MAWKVKIEHHDFDASGGRTAIEVEVESHSLGHAVALAHARADAASQAYATEPTEGDS